MAKKQRKSKNSFSQFLNDNSIKVILGVVASSSFAIAFGQEKISQWVSLSFQWFCLSEPVLSGCAAIFDERQPEKETAIRCVLMALMSVIPGI